MARRTPTARAAAPAAEPVETREKLKLAARRLFAERGIDGVAVRDIVAAGGQRNAASIFYYFGTKESLVRELIVDGARRIDERRNAAFDELERQRSAPRLRAVIDTLVRTSFGQPEAAEDDLTYLRFIAMLQTNHRDLFLEAHAEQWNRGFQRAIAHIRRLLPHLPVPVLNQRLMFMGVYLSGTLAAREAALDDPGRKTSSLRTALAMENLVDTLVAMLGAALSKATRTALANDQAAPHSQRK